MRPPSKPAINKQDPKEWFIYWNHDVPEPLWHKYPRKRIRIKVNDNINRYKGEEREAFAELRLKVWNYVLFDLQFNPFEDELIKLNDITQVKEEITTKAKKTEELSAEQKRKVTPLSKAFSLFLENRKGRTDNTNTISTYEGVVKWLLAYFEPLGLKEMPVNEVTRLQIAEALEKAKKDREWGGTTYNNNLELCMTVFNWLALEEYMIKNPALGKIEKKPEKKQKHRWYDRDTAKIVKDALLKANCMPVYRAMQFTYWLMIRSQSELFKLKFEDIDRVLKRTRFSDELSKNNSEQYRDYAPEFDQVLDDMKFDNYPKHWYVFGKSGEPSSIPSGKNQLSRTYKPIREKLGISDKFTIYSWKHTRIIHEMMKGTDGYQITYMARHGDYKTTDDYKRDYDFTLANVYGPEDLTF